MLTIEELVLKLSEASELYHNGEESPLTDKEYDALYEELRERDPKNLFLTQIGSEVRGGKVDLPYPMGSLDQVYEGDTIEWVRKNGWEDELFVITDKQDGTSALNIHVDGKLRIAYSRGNGFQGADITRHISKMKALPEGAMATAAVRLEVIMEDEVFEKIGQGYKNPRNYVAGKMNASESPQEFYDNVKLIATSVVDPKMGKNEQLNLLRAMGYQVTPSVSVFGRYLTDDFLTELLEVRRKASKTAIDGLVIDLDNAELRESLRRKDSSINPPYSKKFKLGSDDNVAIATVKEIHWRASKNGYLKPRVEIEPIDLVGVTITYATGFNAKFIADNNLGPGAKIQITRSGDVIPYIERVLEGSPNGPSLPNNAFWNETKVDLILDNHYESPEVAIELINGFFGGIDVPFLRKTSIEKLYNAGFTSVESIIFATETELQKVIGDSSGTKIYNGIRDKLNGVDFATLVGSTSILGRGIGKRMVTKLFDALGEDIIYKNPTVEMISQVEDFGEITAKLVVDNIPELIRFLDTIEGMYSIKEKVVMSNDLNGLVVVFTGVRDKELEAAIEKRGGKIGSGVNAKTTHLVAKDPSSTSGKAKKARDLGVEVISILEAKELWR